MAEGFELMDSDVTGLGPEKAVQFFRDLLWSAASDAVVDKSDTHVPISIYESDEGIDAMTEDAAASGFLPEGTAGYQIKAGDIAPAECRNEVTDGREQLTSMVQEVLEQGGTYVLVLFTDLTNAKRQRRENALRETFEDHGFPNADVELYTSSHLIGFANRFPGLVAKYSQVSGHGVGYETWGRETPIKHISTYVPDEQHEYHIETIREEIDKAEECPIIRVAGVSGLGKTRMTYEALSPNHLRNRVIYADAEQFRNSPLQRSLEIDQDWSAILVLDECSPELHEDFRRMFGAQSSRIAVITISDTLTSTEADCSAELGPVSSDVIEEILHNEWPNLPEPSIERVAEFVEGFPQIAALLVENVPTEPDDDTDNLIAIDDHQIFNRLIIGRQDSGDASVDEVKQVLEAFALFERVGWENENQDRHMETEWLIEQFDFNESIGVRKFERILRRQRDRGILEGDHYLSLKPLPLATHLVRSFWRNHPNQAGELITEMPEQMVRRFGERIPYLSSFESGRQWISDVLSPGGWFDDGELLRSRLGSKLFLKFTEASPEEALDVLDRFLGPKSADELRDFTEGRRDVVWALQRIAMWEETFEGAANHLLALGEAETEHSISNNASGEFANLFSPGYGQVSRTELPPMERLPILKDAVRSESEERQKLGLSAATQALKTDHFSRTSGLERQGARPLPDLWMPETYGDLFEYYEAVWSFLKDELETLEEPIRGKATEVLLQASRGISTQSVELSELVRSTLDELYRQDWVDKGEVIQAAVRIVHYEGDSFPEDEQRAWREFAEKISEGSYHARLKRYVGLQLGADSDTDRGEGDSYKDRLPELVKGAVRDPAAFRDELAWLVTKDPGRATEFGYQLGQEDEARELLDPILDEVRNGEMTTTSRLLTGYLRAVGEDDPDLRQETLEVVREADSLNSHLVNLSARSGLAENDVHRILEAVEEEEIEPIDLRALKIRAHPYEVISEDTFAKVSEVLLTEDTGEGAIALLDIFQSYYVFPDDAPSINEELAVQLLTHDVFLQNEHELRYAQATAHWWSKTANELLDTYPDAGIQLLDPVLDNLGEKGSLLTTTHDIEGVISRLLSENTEETWDRITDVLEKRDERMIWLMNWLSGGFRFDDISSITSAPSELLWEWVDEDPETNGIIAARLVPAQFFHDEERKCIARELLKRYGDIEEVRHALSGNYHSESFTGPESEHYSEKRKELQEFKKDEDDQNVLKWVNEEISRLTDRIKAAEVAEESLGRYR